MPDESLNIRSIFDRALEITSDEERTAYLDEVCAKAPEIRQQVDFLLHAYFSAGSFLESPPPGVTAAVASSELSEQPGTMIGPYKLLEQIGEGGMGVVFMAEQQEPVRRKVAVKLIKPGMDTRQVIARFEAERQALAVMDHPGIARVLDAGTTPSGHPYFVMELVRGVPITTYCDENNLSVRDRLDLFAAVCQAIQHAHTKGIIHRDIKPTNVLVTRQDGRAVVKVIDFGVAKAMGPPLTEKTLFTNFAQMIGTPLYMSPEQAEQSGVDIDTRSDIYSLGVLLYELLTGSTPVDADQLKQAAFDEIRRIIREDEPPTPSARISGSHTLPAIAAHRHIEPARLSKLVRGELDWIVMKALEKDRTQRYETANAFAADLLRYLHDEPVLACPPSAKYRLGKYARRNKVALLTIGLVALALIIGTLVSTAQAIRARLAEELAETRLSAETEARQVADKARAAEADQRNIAEAKQAEAEANFQKARAAVDKYFTLVSESTLFDVPGMETLRKDLLEAALEFYEGAALERSDDPLALADMAVTQLRVGEVYLTLTRVDDSVVAQQKSLDSVDRLLREHPNASQAHLRLAGSWKGRRAVRNGAGPSDPLGAMQTLLRLERTWAELARRYPAEPAFQCDLAAYEGLIGEVWDVSGRLQNSVVAHRKGLAILRKLIHDYPTVAQYRVDMIVEIQILIRVLRRTGDKQIEELALVRETADLSETLVAEFPSVPKYRFLRAECLTSLGHQFAKDQPQAAEQSFRRASELAESLIDEFPNQRAYAQIWERAVGASPVFDRPMDDYSQVEEAVNKVIERFEARLKARPNPLVRAQFAFYCENRARQFPRQGDFIALAERLQQRASVLFAEVADEFPDDRSLVLDLSKLHESEAHRLWSTGRMDEAAPHFHAAVTMLDRLASRSPERFEDVQVFADRTIDLARIMAYGARTTDPAETCRLCRRASQMLDTRLQIDPIRRSFLAVAVRAYAEQLLKAPEPFPEAEQMMTWSKPIVEQTIAEVAVLDALTADSAAQQYVRHIAYETQRWLAKILTWTNRPREAEEMWLRAIRSCQAIANDLPDQQIHIQWVLQDYAQDVGVRVEQLMKNGKPAEAVKLLRNVIDEYDKQTAEFPDNREYRAGVSQGYFALIEVMLSRGKHAEAEEIIREAIDRFDKLAAAHSAVPDYQRSRAAFQRQLAQRQASDKRALEAEKSYLLAIDSYEKIIAEFPQYEDLWRVYDGLAQALAANNRPREADEARRKMVEFAPNNAGTLNNLAWGFATAADANARNASLAVELAKKGIGLDPKDVQLPSTLGVAHYRAGNWQDAIEWLEKSMALRTGGDSFDRFFLAMAHWQLGNKDEARKWYAKAVEWMDANKPQDQQLLRFRAEAEELMKKETADH
jgi:serine/threonine protein kinase/Flp pilus assembly protein TadD